MTTAEIDIFAENESGIRRSIEFEVDIMDEREAKFIKK